jgi:hypothetical protein
MVLVLAACAGPQPSEKNPLGALLADHAADAGLNVAHVAGRAGAYRMQEIMGSGAALFDADGDGDLDLFLPQGNFDPPQAEIFDRLLRNDLPRPGAMPRFVDVTDAAGVASTGYSVGAAAADYDGDGDIDLFVAAVGPDRLLRNRGDGTFEDVTDDAGIVRRNDWSVGGVWFDFDRDADLDLFVIRYLDLPPGQPVICPTPSGEKDYCGPTTYEPLTDLLYRNIGGGRFEDASNLLGGGRRPGSGLGAVTLDVDRDGWLDLAVANDKMANFLWINHNGEHFTEEAVERGAAVNEDGVAQAGMGIDAADYDRDGDEDLAIAHLAGETHTLYRNDGGWFADATRRSGLGTTSLAATGFGLAWFDLDRDSHLDLLSVNGHVHRLPDLAEGAIPSRITSRASCGSAVPADISKKPRPELPRRSAAAQRPAASPSATSTTTATTTWWLPRSTPRSPCGWRRRRRRTPGSACDSSAARTTPSAPKSRSTTAPFGSVRESGSTGVTPPHATPGSCSVWARFRRRPRSWSPCAGSPAESRPSIRSRPGPTTR